MNDKEFNKKERQKLIIVGAFCLIAIISVIGYTYSYFTATATNTGTITGTVASASLSLNVEKVAPDTDKALVPQLDSAIASAAVGTQGNCLDDNLNAVCQVYQVTVTNTSTMTINVDGLLELNAGSNPNLKWALINSYTDGMTTKQTVTSSLNSYTETVITTNEEYTANQTKTYYIVVWISEQNAIQNDTGSFSGVVTFSISSGDSSSGSLTSEQVLTNLNLTSLLKTGTPSFSSVATTDEGIYAAEDDLGTSYYFRGASENNYVKFGKNSSGSDMYWRIIRINGDGTVRMIYDGTSAHDNGTSSTDRYVGKSAFNDDYDANGYVGYMYGSTLGSTYALEHANDVNSTIKTFLEGEPTSTNTGWYYENIVATGYEEYVADAIYCNDRSLSSGTGVGTSTTYYGAYGRLYANRTTSVNPVLKCEREEDRFTSEPTVGNVTGNDKLKYPVGLITADEVSMAGGIYGTNENYYLYKGQTYWTMSASDFDYDFEGAVLFIVYSSGYLNPLDSVVYSDGVCPVLSLKADALQYSETSNGTKVYPFILK